MTNKSKEPRSPRQVAERTPPRPRRLSIENCSTTKIELPSKQERALTNKSKEPRSPRQVVERTPPPQPRRLSIENCSTAKTELPSKQETGKGSKTPSLRTRRSSLEGPKYIKKVGLQMKVLEDGSKNQALTFQKCGIIQNSETISRVSHSISNGAVALETNHPKAPPRSPLGATSYTKRVIEAEGTQILRLQLPKTPEPPKCVRNDIQNQMQIEAMFHIDAQTPNLISTTSGKGSRIRRSMRTIGKLINGSEKRQVLSKINFLLSYILEIYTECRLDSPGGNRQFQLSLKGEA